MLCSQELQFLITQTADRFYFLEPLILEMVSNKRNHQIAAATGRSILRISNRHVLYSNRFRYSLGVLPNLRLNALAK